MKLGKDFKWIARLILFILRALLQFAENGNEDTDGDGTEVK